MQVMSHTWKAFSRALTSDGLKGRPCAARSRAVPTVGPRTLLVFLSVTSVLDSAGVSGLPAFFQNSIDITKYSIKKCGHICQGLLMLSD